MRYSGLGVEWLRFVMMMAIFVILTIQVNEKQTTVAALYTSGDLHFWNIRDNTRAYLCCLQPSKFLKATKNKSDFCYGYELSRDGNYVILTRDMPQVMWESLDEQRQSCVVVKLETGGYQRSLTISPFQKDQQLVYS